MRSNKILCLILSTVLILTIMITTTNAVYAADGIKTFTSSGKMSIALEKYESGNSSEAVIDVSELPKNAIITKLVVNTGKLDSFYGVVLAKSLTIKNNNTGISEKMAWSGLQGTELKTSKFLASKANGKYTISFNGICTDGPLIGGIELKIGTKTYSKPSITIYWDDTF